MVNRQANARDARSAILGGPETAIEASAMADNLLPQLGSVPNPDPTLRTVEQLLREIANARELIEAKVGGNFSTLAARIEGLDARLIEARSVGDRHTDIAIKDLKDAIETRLNAMDKVVDKLPSMYDRLAVITDEKVAAVRDLHQEKFNSIGVQFAERDTRTEQTAAGVKIAVDAALQAAKEAVAEQNRSFALATGKSETAMTKQMDALGLAIQTANKGLDDKISDLKDRLTRIEGMDLGSARREGSDRGEKSAAVIAAALELQKTQVSHSGTGNALTLAVGIVAVLGLLLSAFVAIRQPQLPAQITMGPASPSPHLSWTDPI